MKRKVAQPSIPVRTQRFVTGSTTQNQSLRLIKVNSGVPPISEIRDEIDEYTAVLLGRTPPPIDNGEMTLMEYANAVYSRAMELTILIQRAESDGSVLKSSKYYRLRTGELRSFTELAAKCIELGSRRVTWAQLDYSMQHG
ncbi:MAG: hypothetical protein EBU84_10205 [Actinobacteria bacterium]|nr:hypothetical protein [Actinomycetota bacterium]